MTILIISDIHANLTALETVLEDAGDFDAVWCLGDLVGYGPDPNECVERVRSLPNLLCLLGNHDAAAIGEMDLSSFNPEARASIEWMCTQLTEANRAYLARLPERLSDDVVTLVHGSPRSPILEYLLDTRQATDNFHFFETDYCFVGHTHLPIHYVLPEGGDQAQLVFPPENTSMKMQARAILNPGSVGQPRDRDPRASYALFNPQELSWEYRRVAYDIASVQARMQAIGLPERHIQRLKGGW